MVGRFPLEEEEGGWYNAIVKRGLYSSCTGQLEDPKVRRNTMRIVKKPEERRAEMVAAAANLFTRQGFVRTTVAEIVSAVDVAKGLFYYYFTTKDDMVKAVVEGYCSYLGSLADEVAAMDATAEEKLDQMMKMEVWEQCFSQPMLSDLCLPQHGALYADLCDRVYTHLSPALEKIVAQALCERGRDETAAHGIVGVGLYGVLMMARRGEMTMQNGRETLEKLIGR